MIKEDKMNTLAHQTVSKIWSGEFVKAYIITMRPYLLFVSGITGIVGLAFAQDVSPSKAILIFTASFLSYGFGQALTDCFQVDTDSLSAPYRPLTQGIISKKQVLAVSILGLTFCISIFTYFNPLNLILGIIAGLGLATYTPFKRRWWGGPFYNAWIVTVLCLMSFLSCIHDSAKVFSITYVYAMTTIFFGYANFVLTGYFKDITADRATGYLTLPVVFGRNVASIVSDCFALVMCVASVLTLFNFDFSSFQIISLVLGIAFLATGIYSAVLGQIRLHNITTDKDAHVAISPMLHSYLLLLSGISCGMKPEWSVFLILFYIGFVLVLNKRPVNQQI